MLKNSSHLNTCACHLYAFKCVQSSLCDEVCRRAIVSVRHHNSNQCDAASALFSPHRPAGRRVAACLTAHCACPRHLPWLLDVGGGEGLQQGREDPSGNSGRAGKETRNQLSQLELFDIGLLKWKSSFFSTKLRDSFKNCSYEGTWPFNLTCKITLNCTTFSVSSLYPMRILQTVGTK